MFPLDQIVRGITCPISSDDDFWKYWIAIGNILQWENPVIKWIPEDISFPIW